MADKIQHGSIAGNTLSIRQFRLRVEGTGLYRANTVTLSHSDNTVTLSHCHTVTLSRLMTGPGFDWSPGQVWWCWVSDDQESFYWAWPGLDK